ncbi:unnamed protein product, partial [Rotaria magnacalcarata]
MDVLLHASSNHSYILNHNRFDIIRIRNVLKEGSTSDEEVT